MSTAPVGSRETIARGLAAGVNIMGVNGSGGNPCGYSCRDEDPVLAKNRIWCPVPQTKGDFKKSIE